MVVRALAIASETASRVRGAAFRTKPLILAKTCSIGLRSGEYFGRNRRRAGGLDRVSHGFAFVRSQIVEHDDVVALEGRDQELFDVGEKPLAVDGTVEHAGRVDAVVAQRSQECRRLPMAVRDLGDEPTSARRPTLEPGTVGLGSALFDEHQSRRIDALLMASPAPAMALYVRTILLARDKRLFLSVTPMRRKKRLIIAVSARTPRSASNRSQSALSVMSDFSALSASRNSRCGSSLARRYPPILLAAREPLRSKRCTHLMAEDSLTPKRPAAARRLIPPRTTASITRSRKSCEYALAIPAGLRPASRLNQNNADSGIPTDSIEM